MLEGASVVSDAAVLCLTPRACGNETGQLRFLCVVRTVHPRKECTLAEWLFLSAVPISCTLGRDLGCPALVLSWDEVCIAL